MTTPMTQSPRLTCRLVRGWYSIFHDSERPGTPGSGGGHVAACDDCRRFYAAGDELELALRREAPRSAVPPPDDLTRAIMRPVHDQAPRPASRAPQLFGSALACAAACAVLAVMMSGPVLLHRNGSQPLAIQANPIPPATARVAPIDAEQLWRAIQPSLDSLTASNELQQQVDAVVTTAWNSVKPSTDAVLAGDVLQHEVDGVVADARSAVRFLALNFLPVEPTRGG